MQLTEDEKQVWDILSTPFRHEDSLDLSSELINLIKQGLFSVNQARKQSGLVENITEYIAELDK